MAFYADKRNVELVGLLRALLRAFLAFIRRGLSTKDATEAVRSVLEPESMYNIIYARSIIATITSVILRFVRYPMLWPSGD